MYPCPRLVAGPQRPKLALLSAMRQKGIAATKKALSTLHDEGAPQAPDLSLAQDVAPSTLAAEMPMMSPEEGMGSSYPEALKVYMRLSLCLCSAGKALSMYRPLPQHPRESTRSVDAVSLRVAAPLEPQSCELRASLTPSSVRGRKGPVWQRLHQRRLRLTYWGQHDSPLL